MPDYERRLTNQNDNQAIRDLIPTDGWDNPKPVLANNVELVLQCNDCGMTWNAKYQQDCFICGGESEVQDEIIMEEM